MTDIIITTPTIQVYAYTTESGKLIIGDVQPVLEFAGEYYAFNIEKLRMHNVQFSFNEKQKIFTVTDNCPKYKSDIINAVMKYIKEQKGNLFSYDIKIEGKYETVTLDMYKHIGWDEEEYILYYGSRSISIVNNNPSLSKVTLDYYIPVELNFSGYRRSTKQSESIHVIDGKYEIMGHKFDAPKDAENYALKKILSRMFPDFKNDTAEVIKKEELQQRSPVLYIPKQQNTVGFKPKPVKVQPAAAKVKEDTKKCRRGRLTPRPDNFDDIYLSYIEKCITAKDAARMLNVSPYVFKRMVNEEK